MTLISLPGLLTGVQADELPVAVIISKEIKPFIEMVEGFESAMDQPVVRIFMDNNNTPFSHDPLYRGTQIESYSFMVAVGPSALSYLVQNNELTKNTMLTSSEYSETQTPQNSSAQSETNTPLNSTNPLKDDTSDSCNLKILYAMVLNPETIIPRGVSLCGISLNLFSEDTVSKIIQVFPSVSRMGVLFNPDNNSEWFENAKAAGIFNRITTVPIYIREQHDLNSIHQADSDVDALLFIPDKTVTSPTVISHIIKQSIARKIPVIGYNSFFHKSGAALSLILDYRRIGEQMAHKVAGLSRGELCEPSTPAYHMTLNRSVVELLDLQLGSSLPPELKMEP